MKDDKAKDCPHAEVIYGYVEGLLDNAEEQACRQHLTACPTCAALVQKARGSHDLIEMIRESEPSEEERQVIESGREQVRRTLRDS